ncbi:alkane 1-monooxygenase [Oceaniglobus ichthyenteri]|uniref:alkane 1-monooxygenase n=1 Tax=Oceaniglobus ichthyenteri TaxID=2136177 RepID=UPI000D3AB8BD|nr:alkane 1-monooxygenase [Oceaniglobus ichthyenteri]
MTRRPIASLARALPFWLSLSLIPLVVLGAVYGGWTLALVPICTWYMFSIVDAFAGLETENADPDTPDDQLVWYRLITLIWFPLQCVTTFGLIWYTAHAPHLATWEKIALFFGVGVMNGTIGINYAHELMHQKSRVERWMADALLAMAFYSHFRSEHLLVHHRYVATPRDPVSARYNEGFHRFYPRVLRECYQSSWRAEAAMLARKGLSKWHRSNPFWRYWALQAIFAALALALGGLAGLALLLFSAGIAIWQLELANYVEHYGLTRKYLGDGKYEHVMPRHSWNAAHKATNWLLINLQRHSDHHYKPNRRFPLLQTYDTDQAPQLPHGYPLMTFFAMIPPLWRRKMNPMVRAWRKRHYPEITNWQPYSKATNPMPR